VAGAELAPDGPRYVLPNVEGLYLHTNHFLDPHLSPHDLAPRLGPDSYLRLDAITRALHTHRPADLDELTRLLDSHSAGAGSVCCHADPDAAPQDQWATLATIGLDVGAGELKVRRNGPCDTHADWHTCASAAAASVG
jgi:isopenicillin-N N-acyltransferase-like protein